VSHEGETIVWQGNPSWKAMLLFYVKWTLLSLIPVVVWEGLSAAGTDISATWFSVATGVGLVLTYIGGFILRRTTRYLVTDRRIHIRTGIMSRNERTTHVDRVQNVNLNQTIFQRMLGIGDVDWDTAGTDASDADFTFRGVDDPSGLVHAADRYYGVAAVHETAQRDVQ
jgi:uncharacterized membrane protein YdbT with pleckstrin-like domain